MANENPKDEQQIFEELKSFNTSSSIFTKNNEYVLTRMICSFIETFGIENCISNVPEGTIFCRTCVAGDGRGRGYCNNFFLEESPRGTFYTYTTYCNLSPLSNIMIGNPSSVNDSVIFLRAKRDLPMINLNILSQLVGVQVKKGEGPRGEYGKGRGLFSACCQVRVMEKLCNKLGAFGVIQCDEADGYYFSGFTDEDQESILPISMKSGTELRGHVDSLVLRAIVEKKAYPLYDPDSSQVIGGMFPEFNFHLDNKLYSDGIGNIFQQIYASYSIESEELYFSIYNNIENQIYQIDNEEFSKSKLSFLTSITRPPKKKMNIFLQQMSSLIEDEDYESFNEEVYVKKSWSLNEICMNEAAINGYFMLNFNEFDLRYKYDTSHFDWIGQQEGRPEFFVNKVIIDRFNQVTSPYTALPYLTYDRNVIVLLNEFKKMLLGTQNLNACGINVGGVTVFKGGSKKKKKYKKKNSSKRRRQIQKKKKRTKKKKSHTI